MKHEQWRIANDTPVWYQPRRTVYFLTRTNNGRREDLHDRRGRLLKWRTWEQAERVLNRLLEKTNKEE